MDPSMQKLALDMSNAEVAGPYEGEPVQAPPDLESQRALAAKEVERILAVRDIDQVLGGGSWDEQRLEFRRLAKILHPDKGVVSTDDKHAALAMRFAIAAMHKAR